MKAHAAFMRSLWSVLGPLGLGNPAWKPHYLDSKAVAKALRSAYSATALRALSRARCQFLR